MNSDFDVIVVGAGPGGSTAARFCAQAGLKTLIVEKEHLPRYKPCGGCLSTKTVHLFDFDLTPVIENTIRSAKFTYLLRDPFFIHSKDPIAYMVMRDRFDKFLVERALEKGSGILEGERVSGIRQREDEIDVELESGKLLRCEYLIGADGPSSLVARALSLRPPEANSGGFALESEIPFKEVPFFPKNEFQVLHLDFGGVPNGYGWVFPKRDGLSIGVGGMFREGERMKPGKYFNDFLRRLNYIEEERIKIMGHPLPTFYDEGQRVSQGRILLVGDAAHLMDPLQGEGIYYAIRSAMLACEAILQSKERGGAPSDLYQTAIHIHIFENLKWALYFSRFVFRFTKLAYKTLKHYPELGHLYLQVLEGKETYQSFVEKVKQRIKDLLGGRLSQKIIRAMARI